MRTKRFKRVGIIMKKCLIYGVIIACVDIFIFALYRDMQLLPILTGITGGISMLIALLMVGSEPSKELADDFGKTIHLKSTWSNSYMLVALPSLVICVLSALIVYI
ncbi:hypothetical protein [Pradoshia sp.]